MKTDAFRFRFIIWAVLSLSALLGFVVSLINGFPLNTNVLSLLPNASHNNTVTEASNLLAKRIGDQMVFLVGNTSQSEAIKASDLLTSTLQKSKLFHSVTNGVDNKEQQAWASFYYPYRLSLLSPEDQKLFLQNNSKQVIQNAIFNLYSPMGITSSDLIKNDPFSLFQHFVLSLPKPSNHLNLHQNHLMTQYDGKWYVMVNAALKEDSFSLSNQDKITALIDSLNTQISEHFPSTSILKTGMIFYAKAGADSARADISTIGIGSIIGIILLILITFLSIRPLFITLLSSAIGFVSAFMVTYLIFGSVFLFTLVFGASLIGISVDYAFFYYAEQRFGGKNWKAKPALKKIAPGITLGLINIIIAYLVIAIAPFPGLRQLAIFAIVGLGMSYLSVICAFPYLIKAKIYHKNPAILRFSSYYLKLWQSLSVRKILFLFILLFIIIAIGMYQLKINDDIRILESTPKSLKANEAQIKSIIGSDVGMSYIIVTGNTPDKLIANEHTLNHEIKTAFPEINSTGLSISSYLPKLKTQKHSYALQKELISNKLIPFLTQIGVSAVDAKAIQAKLLNIPFKALTLTNWLHSPLSKPLRFLYLGKVNHQYASAILLSDKLDQKRIRKITEKSNYATFINKADEISSVFKTYRHYISLLLIVVFIALFLLLLWRYRSIKKALVYILPPITASLLSLAVLGLTGTPLTLFNLLALVLVLGIAVDYILFFAETRSSFQNTMLATLLSAITTILSFGLLIFSQTPVVHYFGLSVFIGILSAFLLAPIVTKLERLK
ncbi:MMPL family transporter [Fangia hongkongensis]|uniref:MMPL family transporter n=1 Tax=Fangia hongkongensis TaxID=270495 RepID=UPI00036C210E|nr:MMPL family transporter [Fangia hongkongensis]MBK2124640.1 MMPL family transporter [Fangia hongkongensis]